VPEKAAKGKKSEFLCRRETGSVLGIVIRKGFADVLLPVTQIVPVVRATDTPRLWIPKETLCCCS